METSDFEQILLDVVQKAESEIIYFFVIATIALVLVLIPMYTIILKDRKDRRKSETERAQASAEADHVRQDKHNERESRIIDVVSSNTTAITKLTTTLELTSAANTSTIARIHERLDEQNTFHREQGMSSTRLQASTDEIMRTLQTLGTDIKRGLVSPKRDEKKSEVKEPKSKVD